MNKKTFLFKSVVMALTGMVAASCAHKETDLYNEGYVRSQTDTQYATSFGDNVGTVNMNQTWETVTSRKASVVVNLHTSTEYTVGIYTTNPLFDSNASLLAKGKAKEGAAITLQFDAPVAQQNFYVGAFDAYGHGVAQNVALTDGQLKADIGGAVASKARTRAVEDASVYPDFVKTAADYLLGLTENEMRQYTAITDDMIANETSNRNHTLTDKSWYYSPEAFIGHSDGKHFRVDKDVEITEVFHANGTYGVVNDVVLYIEGKVHLKGNTLNGITLVVASGAEIVLDTDNEMSNCGRFIVLPGGKMTGAKGVTLKIANGQKNYNAGEINFNGHLNLNGSDFYNNNKVVVDVLDGTTGGTKFTNFGNILARTNAQAADAYNQNIVNGCYMHFTENAGVGGLTLLDNSRIDVDGQLLITGGLYSGQRNKLYNLSEINAGSIYWNNGVVEGPTAEGQFAVVKAEKFLVSHANDLNSYNNVYFDMSPSAFYDYQNNRLDETNQYTSVYHIVNNGDWCNSGITHWSNEATATITIPAGDCTGVGYNDNDDHQVVPIPGGPVNYSIAFEDLGAIGDFDFNDIVLYVAHNTQTSKATVRLMAAGGELSVDVRYKGNTIFTKNDGKMTNTQTKGEVIATTEVDMTNAATDLTEFSIRVLKSDETSTVITSANETGKAPQALIIPGNWQWPTERTNIKTAYPKFKDWVENVTSTDWYLEPDETKIVK